MESERFPLTMTAEVIRILLPERKRTDHKGSRGGVLICAGSSRYRGAALLAARGALRAGAGLVVLASVPEVLSALTVTLPEAIPETVLSGDDLRAVMERWKERCPALVIGSGLDRDDRSRELCSAACEWNGPSVWDGDGLYWLAEEHLTPRNFAVTPHEGEATRLLKMKLPLSDRIAVAKRLSVQYGNAVLKGYHSLVGCDEELYMVPRGDRTLSVPGSGDVLAGVVGAFAGAGLTLRDSLLCGAWLHGAAGESLGKRMGQDGVLAHEIADRLPYEMKELRAC